MRFSTFVEPLGLQHLDMKSTHPYPYPSDQLRKMETGLEMGRASYFNISTSCHFSTSSLPKPLRCWVMVFFAAAEVMDQRLVILLDPGAVAG